MSLSLVQHCGEDHPISCGQAGMPAARLLPSLLREMEHQCLRLGGPTAKGAAQVQQESRREQVTPGLGS